MLGIVFTEFMEMVESTFSEDLLDDVIVQSGVESNGAYTSVGYYDHSEMIRMVVTLSSLTGKPVDELVQAFGKHLFKRLACSYPSLIEGFETTLDFLETVDGVVHKEVLKLYPEAELPEFLCQRNGPSHLIMTYRSKRPFSQLALGLLHGCADYFGEKLAIQYLSEDTENLHITRFEIGLQS